MTVKVLRTDPAAQLPVYAHPGDAGMDVRSIEEVTLSPGARALIHTGLVLMLPPNAEAQVRPRSGLALKHGITVLNTPGTIDAGYRGEVGVILINLGTEPFVVEKGMKIRFHRRLIPWYGVMLLDIVKYGSAVLREKAVPVPAVTAELVHLAEDMLQTMYHAKGVGLAAQQVGRLESVCVIDVPANCEESEEVKAFNASVKMPLVMFNPVIISKSGEQDGKEGCLSFPNMGGHVVRADQVTCQYTDVSGRMQIVTVRGFLARAVQHETDHLNGVLYVDLMSAEDKLALANKLKKLANKNGGNI